MRFMSKPPVERQHPSRQRPQHYRQRREHYSRNPPAPRWISCGREDQVTEILLRPGETLRIENDGARVMEIRIGARRSVWLDWWRRCVQAWREERAARQLSQLDARLLNDIGLGPSAGHSLAARVHAYRQQESPRLVMARLGLM
jgi:uncharacterized protein YjiS (DUF1127 family)